MEDSYGKAEKSEMSEMLEQTLKLFQFRLFVFVIYARDEKSEFSEQGLFPFNSVDLDDKLLVTVEYLSSSNFAGIV